MSEAWTISREVIIVVIGWAATLWWQSFRFAGRLEKIEQDIGTLRRDVDAADNAVKELDQRDRVQSAANAAAAHLQMQQHAGFREEVAKEYASKRDVEGAESRLTTMIEGMSGDIKGMSDKIDDIRDRLPQKGYPAA